MNKLRSLTDVISSYNLILIDTMNMAARYHYAMRNLSFNGKPTGMLYGVTKFAMKYRKFYPNAQIIFLWEGNASRRKSMNDSYKKSRSKENDFRSLVQGLKPILANMNVDQLYHIGLEADDMAGYLIHTKKQNETALLVSCDEDWFQFMRPGTVDIQRHDDIETYFDITDSLGIPADRMGLYKILKGDKSDEIKGIKNFPSSVARLLVNRCTTLEDIRNYNLVKHNIMFKKWEDAIKQNYDVLKANAELILFHPEWIETSQIMVKRGKYDKKYITKVLNENGIKSLLRELP